MEDELALLRDRIATHEKREEQLMSDIVQIQKKFEFSKKNIDRWKHAVEGDVRPGSHYRKEIVMLKQELDKRHDDIRDREITIENLMAGNHPNHSFLVERAVSQQASVRSSLLDELVEDPRPREMERLLSENSTYAHQIRKQDEEVSRLRKKLAEWEKDRVDMKLKITSYEKNGSRIAEDNRISPTNSERKVVTSFSSAPFNPFELAGGQPSIKCNFDSTSNSSECGDSIRSTKRAMELHNELNKMTKERNSYRQKLEQSQNEAKRLRRELHGEKLQSRKNNDELVSKLNEAKLSSSSLKHQEDKIREMNVIIGRHKAEICERDSIIFELEKMSQLPQGNGMNLPVQQREIRELKKALDESLVELETAAGAMAEQRETIKGLKTALRAKEDNDLEIRLEITKQALRKKDAEIEELALTVESGKQKVVSRDNEIKGLKETIQSWKDRYVGLQKDVVEKENEFDWLKSSTLEHRDNLVKEERGQGNDDNPHLFNRLEEENKLLMQKIFHQTNQLQKADKILFEKELEQCRLKTLVKEMQSKIDSVEDLEVGVLSKSAQEDGFHRNDIGTERSEGDAVAMNLEASGDDPVLNLQHRIESISAQAKDQQYEMDLLVKNFAQLGVSNSALEQKCNSFERSIKLYTDESLRLYNALVRENVEFEPLTKYTKIILDTLGCSLNNRETSNPIIDELENSRLDLIDGLKHILDERKVYTKKISDLELDLGETQYELANILDTKEESKMESFHAERLEKEELARHRDVLLVKVQTIQKDLKVMEDKNEHFENTIRVQAASIKALSEQVEGKDAKITELGKDSLISENSDLKVKNAHNMERVNILGLEVEELKQEVSALSGTKESLGEEVAYLTDRLEKMREVNSNLEEKYNPDAVKMKDQRIHDLERTLHAQEGTVHTLRSELSQVQQSIRNVSEQRRENIDELEQELLESKSIAMSKDRECINLKVKLDECKIKYENEIERLNNESYFLSTKKDMEENNMMSVAKQRLEQLKDVNIELKEDNVKLNSDLEQALTKIQTMEAENIMAVEMERECATLKKKLADLLDKDGRTAKQNSQVIDNTNGNKGNKKKTEKGRRTKLMGWGKS